jgi:hypothetical protein
MLVDKILLPPSQQHQPTLQQNYTWSEPLGVGLGGLGVRTTKEEKEEGEEAHTPRSPVPNKASYSNVFKKI